MDAIILAGGFGTRLRPLTLNLPKPLVPVANQPFLAILLERLRRAGIRRGALSVFYGSKELAEAARTLNRPGLALEVVRESRPLGTGGAIRFAWLDPASSVLVLNGDILSDFDFESQIKAHRASRADATLWVRKVEDASAFGVVEFDAHNLARRFVEKPRPGESSSRFINAGAYVFSPRVRSLIPPDQPISVEREVFPELLKRGLKVVAFPGSPAAYWRDLGTPEQYLAANLDACAKALGGLQKNPRPVVALPAKGGRVIGPHCRLLAGSVVANSVLGPDCVLEDGAYVAESVLWQGCRLGKGARVERCLLGRNVHVGEFAVLTPGKVLGNGAVIPPYSRL